MARTAKCGRAKQSMPGVLGERMGRIPWDHWNSFHWRWGLRERLRWQGEPCGCLGRAFQAEEQLVQNRAVGRYPACLMNWEPGWTGVSGGREKWWDLKGKGDWSVGPLGWGAGVLDLHRDKNHWWVRVDARGWGTKALSRYVSDPNYIALFVLC